jgi:phage-related protein
MANKEYILYNGEAFAIEWYYAPNGRSAAREYYDGLNNRHKEKFLALVLTMGRTGKILNRQKFNAEGDGIYAFKPQPDRFLCFFYTGRKIIVTNGFQKKTQKLPRSEKDRALSARQDYTNRVEEECYYDDN